MQNKQKWSQMSSGQKFAVLTVASIELALTATALVDLVRRPAEQVRGPKALWALGVFIQPVGPIAYLTVGARRSCCSS